MVKPDTQRHTDISSYIYRQTHENTDGHTQTYAQSRTDRQAERQSQAHKAEQTESRSSGPFLSSQLHPQPRPVPGTGIHTCQTKERTNEHGQVGGPRDAYMTRTHPNTLCCPQIPLGLQSPLCHAPHQKTLRSLCPASRHRGRSPEGGRKSRRRHSRRCSKTLCKASPEARSSPQPSQPLQMLSFLSARGVVSILHSLLCQSWPGHLGEVEAQVQGSV